MGASNKYLKALIQLPTTLDMVLDHYLFTFTECLLYQVLCQHNFICSLFNIVKLFHILYESMKFIVS